MKISRLDRMRRMTFDEVRWRGRALARTVADRALARVHPPAWNREDFGNVIARASIDDGMREAIRRGDWPRVNEALIARMSERRSRWVIDPAMAGTVRSEVLARWPDAASDAAARADRIVGGHFDLLGYRGLNFGSDIDWHFDPVHRRHSPRVCWAEVPYLESSSGDHKIIWELNRHQYWLQLGRAWWLTGDTRYPRAIVGQMHRWLDANPPLTGINWASMLEIGFRTISWTSAIHFLLAGSRQSAVGSGQWAVGSRQSAVGSGQSEAGSWLVDAMIAIDRQLTHVAQHLSYYFSPNTHLTGEALALYVVGQAFPELAQSERWVSTGRDVLLREIDRQILADGGHAERSTHYQRYTLDFYLLATLSARRAGDVDAGRAFGAAAARLAEYTLAMADDQGRLPLIGDDDGGMLWPMTGRECNDVRDSLALAAVTLDRADLAPWGVPEETFWIAAPEAVPFGRASADPVDTPVIRGHRRSKTLEDTGYVVMRDGNGAHAVFDVGAHGYMNGGHAHADALSLSLGIGGRPFLVDPGTSTYTMNPALRDRMRGSANHNTVTVDGRPQSIPAGPFHWQTTAASRLHASRHNDAFDWAEASHDGYAPLMHRRSVARAAGSGWLVVDELIGEADDPLDDRSLAESAAHWHFHPGWMLRTDAAGSLSATHMDGDHAWLLVHSGEIELFHGDDASGLGWFAPVYGTLLPTWTARVRQTSRLPLSTVTWIGQGPALGRPSLERIAVNADPGSAAIGARISCREAVATFLLRPGDAARRDSRACGVPDYQTNARAFHFSRRGDALLSLDIVDGSHALALRDGWVSVAAEEPIPDLHARLDRGTLHLSATEPPRQLRVQGSALVGLRDIRLNGRSYQPASTDRLDTLLISGGEWASPPLVHSGAQFALDELRPQGWEEISSLRESSWSPNRRTFQAPGY